MTRPLSIDLRERVVAAVVGGASCRGVATRFGVAVSSVVKWSLRYRVFSGRSRFWFVCAEYRSDGPRIAPSDLSGERETACYGGYW